MKIHGFQKLTMLDFPEKVACTVFTAGCNLRCPFCHNARLVTHPQSAEEIDEAEIFDYLKKRKGLLDGVAITGGEPTIAQGLKDFIIKVKELGYAVKLDTNGTRPEKLRELVTAGLLDYVAMDIKNSPAEYARTVGIENFNIAPVEESIHFLLQNKVDYEFRTTVVSPLHTKKSITDTAKWISGAKKWYLQGFVNSGDIIGSGLEAYSKEFMKELQKAASEFVGNVELRGV